MEKTAKTQPRKELESSLKKARKSFSQARAAHAKASADLAAAQAKVDKAAQEMKAAKQTLAQYGDHLKVMDLTGGEGIRPRGDKTNYIIDGKECHVDVSDINNIEVIPWSDYKKQYSKPTETDEEDFSLPTETDEEDFSLEDFVDDRKLPPGYKTVLANIKNLSEKKSPELPIVVAELTQMSSGLDVNYNRETFYPTWKNSDFKMLLNEAFS